MVAQATMERWCRAPATPTLYRFWVWKSSSVGMDRTKHFLLVVCGTWCNILCGSGHGGHVVFGTLLSFRSPPRLRIPPAVHSHVVAPGIGSPGLCSFYSGRCRTDNRRGGVISCQWALLGYIWFAFHPLSGPHGCS